MRILALVPARGGSKRLPGKNIRLLGGRPLIAWTVAAIKNLPGICDVLVSTDDAAIADIALQAGALVPWLRPSELATDTASSVDVSLHGLDWYEKKAGPVDGLLLLQPTSPFRKPETIRRGIAQFMDGGLAVIGVSPAPAHPAWCFRIEDGELHPYIDASGLNSRSQDLPEAFVVNGAFYLIAPTALREHHSFYPMGSTQPLLMLDPMEAVDIDTEFDWLVAEAIASQVS